MDAEMVRDNALAVSGLLVPRNWWPQREAVSAGRCLGIDCDDRQHDESLHAGFCDNLYRRSLGTFVKRMCHQRR